MGITVRRTSIAAERFTPVTAVSLPIHNLVHTHTVLYSGQGGGEGDLYYLDRHNVACASSEVMRGFRLQRDGGGSNIRFAYYCCTPSAGQGA
jgi:hypothetical protein